MSLPKIKRIVVLRGVVQAHDGRVELELEGKMVTVSHS